MKWVLLSLLISALALGRLPAHAESAKVEGNVGCSTIEGRNKCTFTISINGEIDSTTVKEVARLLAEKRDWNGSKYLVIDSPGGNLAASIAIGRTARIERMALVISLGGRCISACIMILAGAVDRMWSGGKVGIHRPYFNLLGGSQPPTPAIVRSDYEQMLQEIRAYLREMNVAERLADDMLKIEPADVRYLSYHEMQEYGLTSRDPIEQEMIDLQEAQSLGVDRREYIRRQALSKSRCRGSTFFSACDRSVMKYGVTGYTEFKQEAIERENAQDWGLDLNEYRRRKGLTAAKCVLRKNIDFLDAVAEVSACDRRIMKFGR